MNNRGKGKQKYIIYVYANQRSVRLRSCQIVAELLGNLDEIDEDIWEEVWREKAERIRNSCRLDMACLPSLVLLCY